MNQLTIRGFGPELENRLRALAESEGISLNQAALRLLRAGAGLLMRTIPTCRIGNELDRFIGTWTNEEAEELAKAVHDFEAIDESLWR